MDPVYSRDECITAIRDYYEFLAEMFMDRSNILEPPHDGWPSITQESMQGTRKPEEVIKLLRHLPYLVDKPFTHVLPGCDPFNWVTEGARLTNGNHHPDAALIMSEGVEDQFGGRIPKYYIGLMLADRDRDVILLDTEDGLVYWMDCPDKIVETSFPKPSSWDGPVPDALEENHDTQEEERTTFEHAEEKALEENQHTHEEEPIIVDDAEDEASDDEGENGSAKGGEETPPTSDDGNEDDDQDSDGVTDANSDDDNSTIESDDPFEITWGPSWPVRDFFEMLKNHCRRLNFLPRSSRHMIDIWTDSTRDGDPIPEGMPEMLQGIYRKHGWPDLTKYNKEECLAEVKRELDEKYPHHWRYWQ